MHVVNLLVDGELIATHYSKHSLSKTLRLAGQLAHGIAGAEVCIRQGGQLRGYLATDWRGALVEAEVHVPREGFTLVTALNPAGPLFRPAAA
jgi:hypothetical protein